MQTITRRKLLFLGAGMVGAATLGRALPAQAHEECGLDSPGIRSHSLVMAASNAPERWKSAADFVCDGIHDAQMVQGAIDALSPTGGVVLLSEGRFMLNATLRLPNNGITLKGCGNAVTGRGPVGGSELRYLPTGGAHAVELGVSGTEHVAIGLQDLVIICNKGGGHTGNGVMCHRVTWTPEMLKNVGVLNAGKDGICTEQCWGSNVTSCYSRGAGRYGMLIKTMNAGSVMMCHNSHSGAANLAAQENTGLVISGGAYSGAPVGMLFGISGSNYGVSVTGCHFEGHSKYDIYTPNQDADGRSGQVRLWNTTVSNCFFNSRDALCAVLLNGMAIHLELRNNRYHNGVRPIRAAAKFGSASALVQEIHPDRSPITDIPIDIRTVNNDPLLDTEGENNDRFWQYGAYKVTFIDITTGKMSFKGPSP